jgi:hypothetical protein
VAKAKQNGLHRGKRRHQEGKSAPAPPSPEFGAIMEHFVRALALIVVCQRSLAAEVEEAVHEEEVLREAIVLLLDVYDEIDMADLFFRQQHGGGSMEGRIGR